MSYGTTQTVYVQTTPGIVYEVAGDCPSCHVGVLHRIGFPFEEKY